MQQQLGSDEATALSFEDRLGVLVDTEWTAREQRKLTRRLRAAKLRYAASLEAVDFTHPRRLKRQQVVSLGSGAWIADRHNLLIIGPTGIGKSFLASAFVERACRQGFSARYVRMPRLLHEVAVGRGDGSYTRLLTRLAKLDLLAIDDWLLAPLRDAERRDLVEVIEDRAERASTLIASQLPVPDWHAVIGDPNQADAICDRSCAPGFSWTLDCERVLAGGVSRWGNQIRNRRRRREPGGRPETPPGAAGGGRLSARRKRETVLRLLRGEDLESVSRELGITAARAAQWRDRFLAAGQASLKSRAPDARDEANRRLQAKIGELLMETELLYAKVDQLEAGGPLARRRSRR